MWPLKVSTVSRGQPSPPSPRRVALSWRKMQQRERWMDVREIEERGKCRRWGLRIDKERRRVKDGGIYRDSYICQDRRAMDARMKRWMCLRDEGCWLRHRSTAVLSVRPDERFSPAQPPADWTAFSQIETVTSYRSVTMLEILSTEGHLGSN